MIALRQHWRPAPAPARWLLCGALALTAAAVTYWPQGMAALRYDRAALIAGQYWRLATAHLVHLNGTHLLLNLAGLFLLCELLWNDLPVRHGAGALAAGGLAASALLFRFHPELAWYAGMSGAAHGLWAACALAGLFPQSRLAPYPATPTSAWQRLWREWPLTRRTALAGALLLGAKLLAEAHWGASAWTSGAIGAAVVTPAHLYGAIGGVAYLLLIVLLADLGSRSAPAPRRGRRR
jgi:rhomboid family GlyGly-CTERM serine protease